MGYATLYFRFLFLGYATLPPNKSAAAGFVVANISPLCTMIVSTKKAISKTVLVPLSGGTFVYVKA